MSWIDFGRHSEDYATTRPGLPPAFYERLEAVVPLRGARALDLACGPGTIALELAARGSSVLGIDISAGQIVAARRLAQERHLEALAHFEEGTAEHTGQASATFHLVTAGQCWHWFDSAAVLSEVQRLLHPGGVLVIVSYSYLTQHTAVARDSEDLILQFNPDWSMGGWTGVFPEQIDAVLHGGFELVEAFCTQHDEEFSHARWRGRMRTSNGVGSGGLPPSEVLRFDAALARLLSDRYPDPMSIEHRLWCVVARKPNPGG